MDEFSRILSTLRRRGCNLLITGDVSPRIRALSTRKLLGEGDRYRILAVTNNDSIATADRLPGDGGLCDPRTWIIDHENYARCAPIGANAGGRPTLPTGSKENELQFLQQEIIAAISFFDDRAAGDLESAELRVGLDSLAPLLHDAAIDDVRRFLSDVINTVRGLSGMGHCHLGRGDDDAVIPHLMQFFDARIELRQIETLPPEERWHVPPKTRPDSTITELTTDWVKL